MTDLSGRYCYTVVNGERVRVHVSMPLYDAQGEMRGYAVDMKDGSRFPGPDRKYILARKEKELEI